MSDQTAIEKIREEFGLPFYYDYDKYQLFKREYTEHIEQQLATAREELQDWIKASKEQLRLQDEKLAAAEQKAREFAGMRILLPHDNWCRMIGRSSIHLCNCSIREAQSYLTQKENEK